MGQQTQRDLAVPGCPTAHLILIQPDLAFGLREAFLNGDQRRPATRTSSSCVVPAGPKARK